MDREAFIWKILWILNYVGLVLSDDCGPCICTIQRDNRTLVDCADRGFRAVPDTLPSSAQSLNFSGNWLAPENLNGLCKYSLTEIDLSRNHLTSLSLGEFMGCNTIQKIDFSGNIIDYISEGSLVGLQNIRNITNLESRYFNEKALSALPSLRELSVIFHQPRLQRDLFKNLSWVETLTVDIRNAFEIDKDIFLPMSSSLTKLIFMTKSLPTIPQSFLEACKVLKVFELLTTNLHSVPENLFTSSPALRRICMKGILGLPHKLFQSLNNLLTLEIHGAEDMPKNLFGGQVKLQYLDLSGCVIPKIQSGWFSDLWSVKRLNIASVGLKLLRQEDLIGLKSLIEIEMEENILQTLEPFSFKNIQPTVKYIGLGSNSLKNVMKDSFHGLSKLERLDLHSNLIYSIDDKAFSSLRKLQTLNLRNNSIDFLPNLLFHQNVSLEVLDLSSNSLGEIKPNTFEYLESLCTLNISDNQLVSVTDVLESLSLTLGILDLSHNNLSCECVSRERVEALSRAQILGYCKMSDEDIQVETFIKSTHCFSSTPQSSSWTRSSESTATFQRKSLTSPKSLSLPSHNYTSPFTSSEFISRQQPISTQQTRSSLSSILSPTAPQRQISSSLSPSLTSLLPLPSPSISSSTISQKSKLRSSEHHFPSSALSSSILLPTTIQSKTTTVSLSKDVSSSLVLPVSKFSPTTLQPLVPSDSTSRPTSMSTSSLSSIFSQTSRETLSTLSSSSLSPLPLTSSSSSSSVSPTSIQPLSTYSTSLHTSSMASTSPSSVLWSFITSSANLQPESQALPSSPVPVSSTPVASETTPQQPSTLSSASKSPLSATVMSSPLYTIFDISTQSTSQSNMLTPGGPVMEIPDERFNTKTDSKNSIKSIEVLGETETSYGFEEAEPSNKSYYIAVACISTLSVACIVVLFYLWYRRSRRQRGYAVSNVEDQEINNFIMRSVEVPQKSPSNGPIPLKDVPSIQIESIDEENK